MMINIAHKKQIAAALAAGTKAPMITTALGMDITLDAVATPNKDRIKLHSEIRAKTLPVMRRKRLDIIHPLVKRDMTYTEADAVARRQLRTKYMMAVRKYQRYEPSDTMQVIRATIDSAFKELFDTGF